MVWYACYGSNIDETRFLAYLQGGELTTYNGHIKPYDGCKQDASKPRDAKPFLLNRKLLFAEESSTWDYHGVAFISNRKSQQPKTFSKIYLISKVQFNHLFASENGRPTVNIEYDSLFKKGYLNFNFRFYNKIILIDKSYEGFPIITFTNSKRLPFNKPCKEYLSYIMKGIVSSHGISKEDCVDYLVKAKAGFKRKELYDFWRS